MDVSSNFEKIYEYVKELRIMDSHEHLHPEGSFVPDGDILYRFLQHYIWTDVQTAGMMGKTDVAGKPFIEIVMDPEVPIRERWELLEPFWEASRYTGYGQALDIAARDLYDVERIDGSTIEELAKKYAQRNQPGYYHKVLSEQCKIETVIDDVLPVDFRGEFPFAKEPLFKYVIRFPELLSREELVEFGKVTNISIHSLADFDNACEKYVEMARAKGILALKCAYAYRLPLRFGEDEGDAAKEALACLLEHDDWNRAYLNQLQRHLAHQFLRLADKYEMVVQIHTGLLESSV